MKILRLKGGLGNQLFIVAKAIVLSRSEMIWIDARKTSRQDRLPDLDLLKFMRLRYFQSGPLAQIFRLTEKLKLLSYFKYYHDDYFQDLDAISELTDTEITKFLVYFNLLPTSLIDRAVFHIRLGDFVEMMPDYVLNSEFYEKSLQDLPKGIEKFVVTEASDDELNKHGFGWLCGANEFQIVRNENIFDDLRFIAESKYIIGSNSTFCFWATLLGRLSNKIAFVELGPKLQHLMGAFKVETTDKQRLKGLYRL